MNVNAVLIVFLHVCNSIINSYILNKGFFKNYEDIAGGILFPIKNGSINLFYPIEFRSLQVVNGYLLQMIFTQINIIIN